jgi:hypothetical protein
MTLPAPMAKNVAMIVAHPLLYGEANGGVSCDAPLPVGPSVPRPDRHSLSRACSLVRSRRLTDNLRSMLCDPLAGGVSAFAMEHTLKPQGNATCGFFPLNLFFP